MADRIWILPGFVVLGSICAGSLHAASSEQPAEHHVIRIHAEAGYIIMPHTHQVDENIVVLKGSWAFGMGARFDPGSLESMEVGDYGFAPANMAHFALSKTATTIQVHGIGPFATHWLVPMYELSDAGVVLKVSVGDPGLRTREIPVPRGAMQFE